MAWLTKIAGGFAGLGGFVAVLAWLGFIFTRERVAFFGHALLPPDKWWESAFYVLQGLEVALQLLREQVEPWLLVLLYLALLIFWATRVSRYRRLLRLLAASTGASVFGALVLMLLVDLAFANVRHFAVDVAQSQLRDRGCHVPVFEVDVVEAQRLHPGLATTFAEPSHRFYGYLMTAGTAHLLYWTTREAPERGAAVHGFAIALDKAVTIPTIRRDFHANASSIDAPDLPCFHRAGRGLPG